LRAGGMNKEFEMGNAKWKDFSSQVSGFRFSAF